MHRLADPQRRRTIVLITADPERAACWIAAATLLLPQPAALRASFKIFVADARYGQHDIVALHPDWAGPWADADPGSGLAVFDLDAGRASAPAADGRRAVLGAAVPGRPTSTTSSTPSSWPVSSRGPPTRAPTRERRRRVPPTGPRP